MTQGMFSAVSGIQANQTKLDVISDNIANINTVAFKSGTINFATLFNKTISAGAAPTGNLGGVNPKQIGMGVKVNDFSRDFSQGNVQTTGKTTDLNIQGDGYFVLQDTSASSNPTTDVFLTRAGNFSLDGDGVLVNANGLKVLGTATLQDSTAPTTQIPVQIPQVLNLVKTPASAGPPPTPASVTIMPEAGDANDQAIKSFSIGIDGAIEAIYANGDRVSVVNNATNTARELVYYPAEGGTINSTNITVNPAATLVPAQLQLLMAKVTNNQGLVASGSNLFKLGANSGTALYSIGTTAGMGRVDSGALETSNVDLTKEFSSMLISQRAIEANSRSFNTQNSILETIVNMAR